MDLLWKEFFRDPSRWWDARNSKPSSRHPDFKHRVSGEPLWMDSCGNPSWVHEELRSRGFLAEPCHVSLSTAKIDSFVTSLRACTRKKDLARGTHLHHDIVKRGLPEKKCSDALVTMYAKCGELEKAKMLLDTHPSKDVITWTALIGGYAVAGRGQNALECLELMKHQGVLPNAVTYICLLKACATTRDVDKGKQMHNEISRQGLIENNSALGNALVDMYAKCGAIAEARQVLEELPSRDVVSWSALIAGYAQEGQAEQAFNCLEQMQHEGILPNAVTYICTLKACTTTRAAERGKQIHDEIARQGLLRNNILLGNALVDMYAKCGNVSEARRVLEELPARDVVSWNGLIAGYAHAGEVEQALNCLKQMQHEGIFPDAVTYVCALKACATKKDTNRGRQIEEETTRKGLLRNNIVLGNALVDMYAKCGHVSEARRVLEDLPSRDVVSWSALIAGYAQEGEAEQALNCFQLMQREGILPNAVTCSCVLKVCSHRGLVEEGQAVFANMSKKYGMNPSLECYICMIDLFGRAGHLEKAVRLIQGMPSSDSTAIWHALLSACLRWADVNVGGWAFEQAIKLDECDESAYILVANIYAEAGMEEKAKSIEAMRMRSTAWKSEEVKA
ncbi:hypothetical protein GOP47_0020428 [Adiantum capillus-veneris]|uniref:Pentatricopeptide repeat-containing protein n=1 Tax=Adiantum capillus-veneris TaxID=13818 RepID=A0A9D4UDY0_ADICA|nr:hypothetical protein GOP47_0020428 [Adiantum capillus-veneris]